MSPAGEPEWQEGAGGLLLLAAANATALLSQLEEALPMKQQSSSVSHSSPQCLSYPQRSLLLTLFFLPAVGLHRLWELRSYTGRELARFSGRPHPYSYRHTERFLLRLASARSRSSPDQSFGAMDGHLMAGRNKESRSLIAPFLRRWTSQSCLHQDLDSPRTHRELGQKPGLPRLDAVA
jgi:hypothetical protein